VKGGDAGNPLMAADTPFAAITGGSAVAEQVADFVLKRLRQWGIEHVYAYPGDGINGLVAAFGRADDQPQFIQTRHEEMAAFAATGYAKF
jgi:pyruvate dehydrogenase (quinone)